SRDHVPVAARTKTYSAPTQGSNGSETTIVSPSIATPAPKRGIVELYGTPSTASSCQTPALLRRKTYAAGCAADAPTTSVFPCTAMDAPNWPPACELDALMYASGTNDDAGC